MMRELSMHIIDVAENGISAGSPVITVTVDECPENNLLRITVEDCGSGMSREMLESVRNPFATTRTTRKVGLGVPFLAQTCAQCGGRLDIDSEPGKGTIITASMEYDNIDRPQMGDVAGAMHVLIVTHPNIDFKYIHRFNNCEYSLDTEEIREVLDGVPIDEPSVVSWLEAELRGGLKEITGNNTDNNINET